MSEDFVPISVVLERLPAGKYTPRYVRETMSKLGFARKIGREYLTTPGEAESFIKHVKENGLCLGKIGHLGRTSSRTSGARRGTRAAMSPSVLAVVSPERELKEALERIAGPKHKRRSSVTT
jgi:hypothetical protein